MTGPWRGPAVREEPWEGNPPHQALQQWVRSYREARPSAGLPGLEFTKHIGLHAVELAEGMGRIELLRLFSAMGREAECVCGMVVGDRPVGAALGGLAATVDERWSPSAVLDQMPDP